MFKASHRLSTAISYCVAGNDLPTIKFVAIDTLTRENRSGLDSFWSSTIQKKKQPKVKKYMEGILDPYIISCEYRVKKSFIFGVALSTCAMIKAFIEGIQNCINVWMCSHNFLSSIQTKKCLCTKAPESKKKILWKNLVRLLNPWI